MTPAQMAQNLVGEGVEILNVQVTSADSAYGYFYSTNTEIGTLEGILLTTGNATNAIGPNDETGLPVIDGNGNCVTCDQYDNTFPGSPLLTAANGGLTTWDACTFEFDIIPQGDSLRFDFTFGSEEYLEWVGSSFNDVFGFFVSGPNVGTDVNIALIPNTTTAVAINSVNNIDNTAYFYDNQNPLGQTIQYDGLTQGLTAEIGGLTPCGLYHIKLIIADGSDRIYDSGVFISKIVSNPVTLLTSTAGGIDYMIEGCNDGTVTFESSFIPTSPLNVVFTVGGDASIGLDYSTNPDLGAVYNPLDSTYTLTILPGDSTVSFDILTVLDGLSEGTEYVTVTLLEQLCDTILFNSQVNFAITDSLEVFVHPNSAEVCPGNCVTVVGEALVDGDSSFSWSPIEGLDDPTALTVVACPLTTTTYILTSTIASCIAQDSIVITVADLQLTLSTTPVTCINGFYGEIDLTMLNGQAPFTYSWTGPNGFTALTQDIVGLEAGEYCVTVTDASGCVVSDCVTLIEQDVLDITGAVLSNYLCNEISCNGLCDGSIDVTVVGGTGLYSYSWTGPIGFVANIEDLNNLCAGTYTLVVSDENGCSAIASWTLTEPDPIAIQLDGVTDVLCTGEQTGSACVTATGGCTPYFYSWSHDPTLTAPCAINLASDTYTVTVSDVNGCTTGDSVTIFVGEPGAPISITVDNVSVYPGGYNVSCPDAADGSIDITVAGGIPGYIISWTHLETGNTYFTEDLANLPCGTYTCTVTDSNGCVETVDVILSCVPPIEIEYTSIQNPCGAPDAGQGEIHIINTLGGNGGPYSHVWISGPSCPCTGLDLVGLNSGDYILEVTDGQGCTALFTINIGENQDYTVAETIVNTTCFNLCEGSINLDIVPELGTEIYEWTGPNGYTNSTQDIFNLCPGDYSVLITQGNCTQLFNYSVLSPPDIILDIVNMTPPACFGQNDGSIEIAVSGGTGVLSVNWLPSPDCFFLGSNSTLINNLIDCDYIVNVTDEAGCMIADTLSLNSPQVMTLFVETTEFDGGFNVSCAGAQDGQISVSVSGGETNCSDFLPYDYLFDWSSCDDVTLFGNDPNSPIITSLPGGEFCVNVTDCNGCLATTTINFTEPDSIGTSPFVSNYNGFNVSCVNASDGWIAPNVSGGSGTYVEYTWISGNIGANDPLADTLFNLAPDIYCLYLLDTNGCTDTSCFEIVAPDSLLINLIEVNQVSCFGYNDGSIVVEATGGSGGYIYVWEDQDLNPYFGNILTNLSPGTYTLTVEDANGCQNSLVVVLDEPPFFGVSINAPFQGDTAIFTLQCNGDVNGSIISLVEGGIPNYTYSWEDCNMNFLGNDANLSGLGAGCYCLTVTDSLGCEVTACMDITEPDFALEANPTVSLYPGDFNISCAGLNDGWIDLNTTGGVPDYTYIWHINGDSTIFSVASNLTDLELGLYEVLVSDANGCDTTLFVELVQPDPIQSNAVLSVFDGGFNVSCYGLCDGTISLAPSGGAPGYNVNWGAPINSSDLFVPDVCAGSYVLSITDSVGCEIIESITLLQPDSLVLSPTVSNIICNGDANGQICANPSGGSSVYTYSWSTPISDQNCIDNLDVGSNYCVVVTDSNNCIAEGCWEITEPDALSVDSAISMANCGACDGAIDVTATGGTPTYIYSWSGNGVISDNEDQLDLCPGAYTLLLTDANLCELITAIQVNGPDSITSEASIQSPACYGDCDGMISLTLTNAVDPVTITWTESGVEVASGDFMDSICEGNFDVSVVDADGCTAQFQYSIFEPDSISINGNSPVWDNGYNISTFDGNDGSLTTEVGGGTPEYLYEWVGPTTINENETGGVDLTAGEYMLTITDANGCIKDTVIVLTQPFDITLPNGISPNGDGKNDNFIILGVEEHPTNNFLVFNRWGNLVYEKKGYQNDWYGQNMSGEPLADGTYYVIFEADDRSFNTFVDLRR